jgi:FKBP-type peptidyl-prolyl cis-trans isomerase
MSRRSLITGVLLFVAGLAGFAVGKTQEIRAQETPAGAAKGAAELKTADDKVAYALGLTVAQRVGADAGKLNPDLIAKGFLDGLKKNKPLLTDDQIRQVMSAFIKQREAEMREKEATELAKAKPAAEKNLKEGQDFLAANKEKEGVKTTESGLQYQVLKSGSGASPKATDVVKVHYHGTLPDGKVFDSSVKRGEPAEFPVNGVIPGWTEALQKMKVGDKWKLFVPSSLAYRERGFPGSPIGPNQVLIFEVELLDVVD